jgi:hypothetical protein
MTVIASFFIENNPFMISDLLISVKATPRDRRFQTLPDAIQKFNLRLPDDSVYTITDVRQKTVKIADRFVLSYAGPLSQAGNVIDHFWTVSQSVSPSEEMFRMEMNRLETAGRVDKQCSVMVLIEGNGRIFAGTHNVIGFRSRKFRFLRAGGSGAKDLLDVFAAYRGKETNRELNCYEEGVSLSLAFSSYLLGKEMATGEPLQRAYGGFYEVSYWNGTDFEKVRDVLHVHWVLHHKPSQGLFFDLPTRLQKLTYHDSILYLRDLDITPGQRTDDVVYIVSAPGKLRDARPPSIKPDLSYKWVVDHLYIVRQDGKVRYLNRVRYVHSGDYGLRLDEQGSSLSFAIKTDYFDFLKEEIAELDES